MLSFNEDVAERSAIEDIEELWWLLHHSDDENNLVLGVTAYLDDSGSDDNSRIASIGGPLVSRIQAKAFAAAWIKILQKCGVENPLHMSDFVSGKYAGWPPEFKRNLFLKVAKAINDHKLISLSVLVSQDDFNAELTAAVKKNLMSPYAFCFFCTVVMTRMAVEHTIYFDGRIAYLVDTGYGHKHQLEDAHSVVLNIERESGRKRTIGAFAFDDDRDVPTLQAADVVAWASRKIRINGSLPEGFEPLQEIFAERSHQTVDITTDMIRGLADPINEWISSRGDIPLLSDILRP